MKKSFLTFLHLFIFSLFFSQNEDSRLYQLVFENKSNFKFLTLFNDKIPQNFQIGTKTITWNEETFYMKNLDLNNKEMMKKIEDDEHSYYRSTYLFSDLNLNKLITDESKQYLATKALSQKSTEINLSGKNFKTVDKLNKKNQFFFYITKPIYSKENDFAFVYVRALKEQFIDGVKEDEYYGYVLVVFRKTNNNWQQIAKKDWIIL